MRTRQINVFSVDIKTVIKNRLNLQTTQRYFLEKFEVKNPTFEVITSSSFISRLRLWDDSTKKAFYLLAGGGSNMERTRKFFEELMVVSPDEIKLVCGEMNKETVKG